MSEDSIEARIELAIDTIARMAAAWAADRVAKKLETMSVEELMSEIKRQRMEWRRMERGRRKRKI